MKSILKQMRNSYGPSRTLSCWLFLLLIVCLATVATNVTLTPSTVLADDNVDVGAVTEPGDDGPKDSKPAEPKEDAKSQGTSGEKPSDSLLGWMGRSLGWSYGIAFLALSITLVSFLVTNILGLRRETVIPSDLVINFEAELREKRYQEAYQLAKGDESFLGQVLSAGLSKLQFGYEHAIEAMQEASEDENMRLEHRLSYISLIGNISPMIGLLGTVQGMIASFQTIANSDTTPPAREIAAGVSTALFTTLIGLMIAIPAIAAFNILRNRASRLVLEAGMASEDLMGRFQTPPKRKRTNGVE